MCNPAGLVMISHGVVCNSPNSSDMHRVCLVVRPGKVLPHSGKVITNILVQVALEVMFRNTSHRSRRRIMAYSQDFSTAWVWVPLSRATKLVWWFTVSCSNPRNLRHLCADHSSEFVSALHSKIPAVGLLFQVEHPRAIDLGCQLTLAIVKTFISVYALW